MKQSEVEHILIQNTKDIAGLIEISKNFRDAMEDHSKRHVDAVNNIVDRMSKIEGNLESLKVSFGAYELAQIEKEKKKEEEKEKLYNGRYAAKWIEWWNKLVIGGIAIAIIGGTISSMTK